MSTGVFLFCYLDIFIYGHANRDIVIMCVISADPNTLSLFVTMHIVKPTSCDWPAKATFQETVFCICLVLIHLYQKHHLFVLARALLSSLLVLLMQTLIEEMAGQLWHESVVFFDCRMLK